LHVFFISNSLLCYILTVIEANGKFV